MKKVATRDFCTVLVQIIVERFKAICFGLWSLFWVLIDGIKTALNQITGLDLVKIMMKAALYFLCAACWIFIFFGITFVGWAII